MDNNIFETITKRHSTTFYYASLFFPKSIRQDVFILYAFLRTADDLVDELRSKMELLKFKKEVYKSLDGGYHSKNRIVIAFIDVYRKYAFGKEYLDSFFGALEFDCSNKVKIKNNRMLKKYLYGVAGVVGLMMAKIMGLPKTFFDDAKKFGELMQMVNIIRDIKEDYQINRVYLPFEDMNKFGLGGITDYKNKNRIKYERFIRFEIKKVIKGLEKIMVALDFIPQPYRRAVKISGDIYILLAKKIYKEPMLVWQERVSASKFELLLIILKNIF